MNTPKIQEFEAVVEMAAKLPAAFESIDNMEIRLKGFNPDEIRYLSLRYNGLFQMPDQEVNRYRSAFNIGDIQLLALSEEYRINYSFAPLKTAEQS